MSSEVEAALSFRDANEVSYSEEYDQALEASYAIIREMVIEQKRIDILSEFVLGYEPLQFHKRMMNWQNVNDEGLLLAWRGSGKTTYCTISRCIFEIIKNSNVRILLAADSLDQAKVFLRSIKSHLEDEKFKAIFGDYVTGAKTWSESEIIVNKRTSHAGEPTIMCAGMGTALPSRHFDIVICDDLVTEDNSRTEGLRKKTFDYFYKTLFPTLDGAKAKLWILGTRWHDEDLYGWLEKEDYKEATLHIGVLDKNDKSRWEEKFPTERMLRIQTANLGAFELQYMCRGGITGGGIFSRDHFIYYDEIPDMFVWQGVDLAIGQKSHNDFFCHVTLGINKMTRDPYLIEYRRVKLPFPAQVRFIASMYENYPQTVRVVLETNSYQQALKQQIRAQYPNIPTIGRYTRVDKITRAQQLAWYFTDHPMHVKRGHGEYVKYLCGFPGIKGSKDLFDATELAVMQGIRGAKRRRRNEPGLI